MKEPLPRVDGTVSQAAPMRRGAWRTVIGKAATRFDAQGNLVDDARKGFVRQLLENLVAWTRRFQQAR